MHDALPASAEIIPFPSAQQQQPAQPGDGACVRRALQHSIAAAQRLGAESLAGELMGALFIYPATPDLALAQLHGLRARAHDAAAVSDHVNRAIALLEDGL